jgi:hypothetical protein
VAGGDVLWGRELAAEALHRTDCQRFLWVEALELRLHLHTLRKWWYPTVDEQCRWCIRLRRMDEVRCDQWPPAANVRDPLSEEQRAGAGGQPCVVAAKQLRP